MILRQVLRVPLVLMASLSVLGCATIISGASQEVSFHSNPEGATVSVDGKVLGKAPLTVRLDKKAGQSLSFEKDGFKKFTTRLDTRLNPWFWGNIVIGGFFGSTTDGVSGAIYEYSPGQYMASLEREATGNLEGSVTRTPGQKAREFIIVGYNNIMSDLRQGEGPHVASLLTLLGIPQEGKREAVQKIRALSEVYTDIPSFADHVIELYIK